MSHFQLPQYYCTPLSFYFSPVPPANDTDYAFSVENQNQQIKALTLENQELQKRVAHLQAIKSGCRNADHQSSSKNGEKQKSQIKQIRKRKKTVEVQITCPYPNCNKFYGSTLALNLHIKLKHNGGTKKERETYAKIIFTCEENGEQPPKFDCCFPPGFLQEQREHLAMQKLKQPN